MKDVDKRLFKTENRPSKVLRTEVDNIYFPKIKEKDGEKFKSILPKGLDFNKTEHGVFHKSRYSIDKFD